MKKILMNLQEILQKKSKRKVFVRIKDYKSTYISVLCTKSQIDISLHKLFLDAPVDVKQAVICYCQKRDKTSYGIIKKYANEYFSTLDYSHKLDVKKLDIKGRYFDLKQILGNLNLIYFNNALDLNITWFVKPKYKRFNHITFGSFDKNLKLVRINKLLDQSHFPFYFINYIVYHEMLHYICKEKIDERGRRRVHTKKFKEEEKKFAYYKEAVEFEKMFLKRGRKYGRA